MIIKSYEVKTKIINLIKHNLFLLYGENYGLKKDIKEIIQLHFKKNNSNLEIVSIYENEILENEEDFYNSIYSGSLFSNQKIIIINNGSDKLLKLVEDILNKKPENILLIIYSEILEKKSKLRGLFEKHTDTICVPCYLDSDRDLEIIISNELKKNNIIASREVVNLLIEKSNQDRNNLRNELEKIQSYAYNKKNLNADEVKSIINFSGEHKSDHLINECLCGNIFSFKKILSELYSNAVNQIFLLRILSNKMQRLLKMKELQKNYKNVDSLISETKPVIFWKEKPIIKKQLLVWNIKDLKGIFHEINDIELLCKKNPQISKIISFNFFSKICKKANNFSLSYQ